MIFRLTMLMNSLHFDMEARGEDAATNGKSLPIFIAFKIIRVAMSIPHPKPGFFSPVNDSVHRPANTPTWPLEVRNPTLGLERNAGFSTK